MSCRYLDYDSPAPGRWHRLWCSECRAARAADSTLALGMECLKAQSFPDAGLSGTLKALGLPSSPVQHRRRLRLLRRKVLVPAGMFALLLAFAGYSWLCYIDRDPDIPVYTPPMPSPNAYNSFQAAGRALTEATKIRGLGADWKKKSGEDPAKRRAELERRVSMEQRLTLLIANREALDLLRQGLNSVYREPPDRSMQALYPHLANYKALAYLFGFEGDFRAAMEEWEGAANSGLDAIQLGTQIQHGSPMIGKLTGIACEAIGRQTVLDVLEHLSAQEALDAARRLEKIMAQRVSFRETLQEEKWIGLASLQKEILTPGWRSTFHQSFMDMYNESSYSSDRLMGLSYYIRLLPYTKREIVENYSRSMDQAIADSLVSAANPIKIKPGEDPVNQLLLPDFTSVRLMDINDQIQNTMLHTALALQAYRMEKGAYPETLDQLVPRYIQTIPEDLFAPDSPFVSERDLTYSRMGQTYVLYSLGPDRRDNGGRQMQLSWQNAGDIVAEINQ